MPFSVKILFLMSFVAATALTLSIPGYGSGPGENKTQFVYLALGASDATGIGATPLTEGYVFLVKRELDRTMPGVLLINQGIPGPHRSHQGTGARREAARHQGGSHHHMGGGQRSGAR